MSRIILTTILLGGLLLRLFGIHYGLPFIYDLDESDFVVKAVRIIATKDLNPHWFGHPGTTVIYLLPGLYNIIYMGGAIAGVFANIGDFIALYYQDPTVFYLSGRIMFALFGTVSVLLLYRITRRVFNQATALIAAAFFALSPLHISYSKLIRTDILMTCLILVIFW